MDEDLEYKSPRDDMLEAVRENIMNWLTKYREETHSQDQKLELILFSLASMCQAMKDTL